MCYNIHMKKEKRHIIFDVDGTIADVQHRRKFVDGSQYKDWPSFKAATVNDTPIQWVCEAAKQHVKDQDVVIFVSARNTSEKDITVKQIQEWIGIQDPILFLRPDGDFRPDHEFKQDVLGHIQEAIGGNPDLVYDDRNVVVDMWRSHGIEVNQVVDRISGDF